MRGRGSLVVLLVVAVALAGCVGEEARQLVQRMNESFECADATGVDNQLGGFSYAGAATCKSAMERYDWENPGPRASVDWGGAVESGYLNVTIYDSLDRVVHAFSLDGTGASGASGTTDLGAPGPAMWTWTIEVEFDEFTGSMGLHVRSLS